MVYVSNRGRLPFDFIYAAKEDDEKTFMAPLCCGCGKYMLCGICRGLHCKPMAEMGRMELFKPALSAFGAGFPSVFSYVGSIVCAYHAVKRGGAETFKWSRQF